MEVFSCGGLHLINLFQKFCQGKLQKWGQNLYMNFWKETFYKKFWFILKNETEFWFHDWHTLSRVSEESCCFFLYLYYSMLYMFIWRKIWDQIQNNWFIVNINLKKDQIMFNILFNLRENESYGKNIANRWRFRVCIFLFLAIVRAIYFYIV